jgi:hypothetical protein
MNNFAPFYQQQAEDKLMTRKRTRGWGDDLSSEAFSGTVKTDSYMLAC